MKKKVIAFSVLAVIVAFVVTFLLCKPKYNYMVDFEENFVVENGVAPEEMEYVIVLSEYGGQLFVFGTSYCCSKYDYECSRWWKCGYNICNYQSSE